MSKSAFLLVVALLVVPSVAWAQDAPAVESETPAEPEASETKPDDTPTPAANDAAKAEPAVTENAASVAQEPEPKWVYGGDESTLVNYRLPRNVLEVQLQLGGNYVLQEVPINAEETGGSAFGGYGALGVAWRFDHVFSAFIEMSFAQMGSMETDAKVSDTKTVQTEASLTALSVHGGVLFDLWYFRARAGVGMSKISNTATVAGDEVSSSNVDFTYVFGFGGTVYRDSGLQLGMEFRTFIDPAIEAGYFGLGITGAYDVLSF